MVIVHGRNPAAPDDDFDRIGTSGTILDWQPLPNQMIAIQLQGEQRVRVSAIEKESDGLLVAEVEYLAADERITSEPQTLKLMRIIADLAEHPLLSFPPAQVSAENAASFSYQLAALLPLSGADKQRLLELDNPVARLESIYSLLKER